MPGLAISRDDLIHLMENYDRLGEEGVRELMGHILLAEPAIGWEVGPVATAPTENYLALTAGGNAEKLAGLERDLRLPIHGSGWRIVAGIPPKAWNREFEIQKDSGVFFPVSGDWCRYVAQSKMRKFVLQVRWVNMEELSDREILCASEILVVGEIGELNFAKYIELECGIGLQGERIDYLGAEFSSWVSSLAIEV